jgi:hypothetical protein
LDEGQIVPQAEHARIVPGLEPHEKIGVVRDGQFFQAAVEVTRTQLGGSPRLLGVLGEAKHLIRHGMSHRKTVSEQKYMAPFKK